MATVTLENVTKTYRSGRREVHAVDNLNLTIADRTFVVLLGPSGCGKTTTLRLVAGLEDPNEGIIRIDGRVVNDVSPKDRDVAMVFQNYALYPHMTVFKNMGFGLKMRGESRDSIRRQVHEAAALLGIEHLLDRKPAALSGGECQRVAVGRAIVRRPKVFLFDEPLSNLDASLRTHMRAELKRLHRELEATILYVTHDQEEAMTLGDRLILLSNGVEQQHGRPLDLYDRPANQFAAGFIGTPPMSLLKGRIEQDGKVVVIVGDAGWRLTVSAPLLDTLSAHVGLNIVVGFRSEHVRLVASSSKANAPNAGVVETTVALIEPLGDRLYVHGRLSTDESLVARCTPRTIVATQERRQMLLGIEHAHIFHADTDGARLDRASPC